MERKALNSLGYMELAAFFVFGTFLLGLYYDIVWLQWVTAILFILPMAGVLRYPSRCKAASYTHLTLPTNSLV